MSGPDPSGDDRLARMGKVVVGDLLDAAWRALSDWAAIRPDSGRARRFRAFGAGSAICFRSRRCSVSATSRSGRGR